METYFFFLLDVAIVPIPGSHYLETAVNYFINALYILYNDIYIYKNSKYKYIYN